MPEANPLPAGAIVLPPDGGRTSEMKTLRAVFKADGEETGNRYCVSEWWLDAHKPGPVTTAWRRRRSYWNPNAGRAGGCCGRGWPPAAHSIACSL